MSTPETDKLSVFPNITDELVVIRKADEGDGPAVLRLFQAHLNWINVNHPPERVFHRSVPTEGIMGSLRDFPSAVAEGEDRVIGFCITRPLEPFMLEVRNVYVDDPYRQHGLAKALVAETEKQAWERGYRVLFATASAHWYPGKWMPTKLFMGSGYKVTEIDEGLELYLKKRPDNAPLHISDLSNGLAEIQRFDYMR